MAQLFDPSYTMSEYRAHLGRLLGIFEPLEGMAARAAAPADSKLAIQRSGALREDLCSMGATGLEIDALERCSRLPPISPAGLRGYAYVILGSMLGGKIIVKRLRAVLSFGASFRFYGDENGRCEARWVSFCSDLEENGQDDVQTICATAAAIFDAYGAWLAAPLARAGNF